VLHWIIRNHLVVSLRNRQQRVLNHRFRELVGLHDAELVRNAVQKFYGGYDLPEIGNAAVDGGFANPCGRQELFAKTARTAREDEEMMKLSDALAQLGFARTIRDPLYEKFVKAVSEHPLFRKPVLSPEELRMQNKIAAEVINEILDEEKP
jgi:hypothetical protein